MTPGDSPADPPRVLLFTGKGGAGRSTIAPGTAVLAADAGLRTPVLSTDAATAGVADGVAAYRRLLTLPAGLARHSVTGARVIDGELRVPFEEAAT